MNKLIYIIGIIIAFASCESIEDTYSDYNTPKERYVGMCSDLKIELGWERFRLTWTNSADASIDSIKVKWEDQNGIADSVLLPAGTDTFETDTIFSNQTYKFIVTSIDSRMKESFPVEVYGSPFTYESSEVKMLGVVEKKFYFVEEQLILLLNEAGKDIYEAKVNYTSGGEVKVLELEPKDFENGLLVIESVDKDTDVSIAGKMQINRCIDEIPMMEYTLERDKKVWSGSFIGCVRDQLDILNITEDHLDTIKTLYVDFDIISLEDVLYMPNLEKVVLGKGRMNQFSWNYNSDNISKLEDVHSTLYALRKMNEVTGLEVVIYGDHYQIKDSLDFAVLESSNPPPAMVYPDDVDSWDLSINDPSYYNNEDPNDNYNRPLNYLLSDDSYETWRSKELEKGVKTHEIIYDMKEVKEIEGFQYSQANWRMSPPEYFPTTFHVHISDDGEKWETAYYQAVLQVGAVKGETIIKYMREPKMARYIKLTVRDIEVSNKNNFVELGKFIPLLK